MNERGREILESVMEEIRETFIITPETEKHLESVFRFGIQKAENESRRLIAEFEARREDK